MKALRRLWAQAPQRRLLVVLAGVVVVLCYLRLYFGADPTDEGFYAAIPYEFLLGNRPFVDELNSAQFYGFLTYPLVRGYIAVASQEGLVLALRHAYFLFVSGVAVSTVLLFRRVVSWPWLVVAGLAYMALVPWSLPTLSYNTLTAGFLAYGFLLGLHHLIVSPSRWSVCLAGVFQALAVVAYPPLLLALPVFAAALGIALRGGRARSAGLYALAAGCVLCLWGILLLSVGVGNVSHAFAFTRETAAIAGGFAKIEEMFVVGPAYWAARVAPAALLAVAGIATFRMWPRISHWCIALIPISGLCLYFTGDQTKLGNVAFYQPVAHHWAFSPYSTVLYIILLALYSGLVVLCDLAPSDRRRTLIIWGLAPAVCAGVITAYASSNGFVSAWLGLAPCVLIACIAPGLAAASPPIPQKSMHPAWLHGAAVVAIVAAGMLFQWTAAYYDAPPKYLTVRVESGPYRGLYTTPARRELLQGLAEDLGAVVAPSDRLLVPYYSGSYLLTKARPAGPSVWLLHPDSSPAVRSWYRQTDRLPTVVVRFRDYNGTPMRRRVDYWGAAYQAVRMRDAYAIYRRTVRPQ